MAMIVGRGITPKIEPKKIRPKADRDLTTRTPRSPFPSTTGRGACACRAASPGRSGTSFTYRISATRIPTGIDAYTGSHRKPLRLHHVRAERHDRAEAQEYPISPSPRWTSLNGGAV
jgi:hypothetical protein